MRRSLFFLFIVTIGSLGSCGPRYPDLHEAIGRQTISLPEYYFYTDVSWPSDDLIALAYYPKAQITFVPNRLLAYHLSSGLIDDMPMPPRSPACDSVWGPVSTTVSPSGNLAFTAACQPLKGPHLWIEYDLKSGKLNELFDDPSISATHFTFIAPDKIVQEDAVGSPMSNELWIISLVSRTRTRILSDFLRASSPTWSHQEKLVAFWATKDFPGGEPKGLYTWEDISRLVQYPWDLYVMGENAEDIHKVFPLVENAGALEWSPTGHLLAFSGRIDKVDGIWLIDINGAKPIRVFEHSWLFTWSPDGKKMIVIETKFPDEKNNDVPVKAYMLEFPNCIFVGSCN